MPGSVRPKAWVPAGRSAVRSAVPFAGRQEVSGCHWWVMQDPEGNEFCVA
ncbi:VOC family protein [Streptomyces sp. NPDC056049]